MKKQHQYKATTKWTGNLGQGTTNYKAYDRSHTISIAQKSDILGSSDPAFRGDKSKHSPEDLLLSALSGCHMLWYLHLCSENNVLVLEYTDHAHGKMDENADGSGQFTEVILNPMVTVANGSMIEKANALHDAAHNMCFIARSVNFSVHHVPSTIVISKTSTP